MKPLPAYKEFATSSDWEYITTTPAHGLHYYNREDDVCAVVYYKYARVYSVRRLEFGNTACCFEECEYVYKEK